MGDDEHEAPAIHGVPTRAQARPLPFKGKQLLWLRTMHGEIIVQRRDEALWVVVRDGHGYHQHQVPLGSHEAASLALTLTHEAERLRRAEERI